MASKVILSTDHPSEAVRRRAYAAQDALRTMQAHEAIKTNPQLLRDAQTLAKQQIAGLAKVAALGSGNKPGRGDGDSAKTRSAEKRVAPGKK